MTNPMIFDELAYRTASFGGTTAMVLVPFLLALGIVFAVLAVLVLVFAYRSRHTSPTSPYIGARPNAKVARLGYFSMQQGKRIAPEPHTVPVEPVEIASEDKEIASDTPHMNEGACVCTPPQLKKLL